MRNHTSVLRFLAEKFTPGTPYSDRVAERHKNSDLVSLADVLSADPARETPDPPRLGPFQTVAFPSGRPAKSDAEKMFVAARQQAHADHPDALGDIHPESFFKPR
jgi:hypothetical protein